MKVFATWFLLIDQISITAAHSWAVCNASVCHDEKWHKMLSNTWYCPKFDGEEVCGGLELWGAIEKYQSTSKVWTPARRLAFFFMSLLALPCCDAGRRPNNHTDVDPSRTNKTQRYCPNPHIVGNVMLLAIVRCVVEIVRGNRSKVRGGSLSRSLILHSNR
jgi:hypothetical protein